MQIKPTTTFDGLDRTKEITNKAETLPGPTEQDRQAVRKAAEEFESIFLEIVLKSMRESVQESGLVSGGNGENIFRSMLDSEYTKSMASQDMTGIATAIEKHLLGLMDQTNQAVEKMQGQAAYKESSNGPFKPN